MIVLALSIPKSSQLSIVSQGGAYPIPSRRSLPRNPNPRNCSTRCATSCACAITRTPPRRATSAGSGATSSFTRNAIRPPWADPRVEAFLTDLAVTGHVAPVHRLWRGPRRLRRPVRAFPGRASSGVGPSQLRLGNSALYPRPTHPADTTIGSRHDRSGRFKLSLLDIHRLR